MLRQTEECCGSGQKMLTHNSAVANLCFHFFFAVIERSVSAGNGFKKKDVAADLPH